MDKGTKISLFFTIGLVFTTFILMIIIGNGGVEDNDYARITDVEYKAVLVDEPDNNAKIVVTERLTYDIHADSYYNLYWELWRDLPEAYVDGVKVSYKVNSVKQILPDGEEVIYTESDKLYWEDYDYESTYYGYGPGKWYHSEGPYDEYMRQYECVFFYIDGIYREEMVFEIEYEMYNAALRYGDSSELYISMYSEETINYLDSFKGQILIADKDMPRVGNYEAHTYGTKNHSFEFKESNNINPGYHTFYFDLEGEELEFKPYNEFIEFTLVSFGDDKHIFTEYAPINDYYNDDVLDELRSEQAKYDALPKVYETLKIAILVVSIGVSFLIIRFTRSTDKRIRKKYVFYTPKDNLSTYKYIPSNLDPTFAAALVFCKDKAPKELEDSYSAILLSLVRKGYVDLVKINEQYDWNNYNVKIVVKYRPVQLLSQLGPIPPGQASITEQTSIPVLPVQPYYGSSPIIQPMQAFSPMVMDTTSQSYVSSNNTYDNSSKNLEPLTLTEEYYFNLIMRHSRGMDLAMHSFQDKIYDDYEYTESFVKKMDNSIVNIGISQGYFQKADYNQPRKDITKTKNIYILLGILTLFVLNFAFYKTAIGLAYGAFFIIGFTFFFCSSYLSKIAGNYVLLSQFGEDEYAKWRGLYNFLNSDTIIKDSSIVDLGTWEQYLIYATAFGIADKVNNALNIKCPIVDNSQILNNRYYRSRHFRHTNRSFRTTARSASHASLSGGHGGYGGGGRGGGGGGGGH